MVVYSSDACVGEAGPGRSRQLGTQLSAIGVAETQLLEKSLLLPRICISKKLESATGAIDQTRALRYGIQASESLGQMSSHHKPTLECVFRTTRAWGNSPFENSYFSSLDLLVLFCVTITDLNLNDHRNIRQPYIFTSDLIVHLLIPMAYDVFFVMIQNQTLSS